MAESEKIKPFVKEIPINVRSEIEDVVEQSKKDGRERSLTFCRYKGTDSVHVSAHMKGGPVSVFVDSCGAQYGDSEKIGDFHVHPVHPDNMGIVPSEADMTGTLEDSQTYNIRQVACISNHDAKHVHCYQPKELPTPEKIKAYNKALENNQRWNSTDPFFRTAVAQDFNHAWYDKKNYQRQEPPNVKAVVVDVMGKAARSIRTKNVPEMEKGTFCQLMADYNLPHMVDAFVGECKQEIRRRTLLGIDYEKYLVD